MKSQLIGKWGEAAAAEYLRKKGYEIREANYSTRFGEIDLIAKKRGEIIFVEVKTRKDNRFANAFEAVTFGKQKRILLAAKQWLSSNDPAGKQNARFDVIEVYLAEESTMPFSIKHIENAFTSEGYEI
ncbi:MAG: YraN family protein [Clostridiales bacterium]|nr:YraN family protein [Clostridiales bacterium]